MKMLKKEEDILNEKVRQKIIEEIEDTENSDRKREAYKRYEVDKDMTAKYVEDLLLRQFDQLTVEEMKYSISNLSLCRKIVDKLARVYSCGAEREMKRKKDSKKLEAMLKALKFDAKMKKTNRYLKLFKNTMLYIKPKKVVGSDGVERYSLKLMPLPPFLYDVIENPNDKEEPMVVVMSSFDGGNVTRYSLSPSSEGRGFKTAGINNQYPSGDGKDQLIADSPHDGDEGDKKTYVFWSSKFHFTTNNKGVIIDQTDIENPIQELPFVNFSEGQDGNFWSTGGSDIVDGCILINSTITNMTHIGVVQGYGQPVMIGKNLPQRTKVGPNYMIKLEQNDGEPTPDFKFVNSNAPLGELKENVVMYVALLLTTNNLSTSGVKTSLDGGGSFPSGVAMMIDKSESIEDVQDQQQIFIDNEPQIFRKIFKWLDVYDQENLLVDDAKEWKPSDIEESPSVKFCEEKPLTTEMERLDVLQKRKDMGLSTQLDLIKADNPEMSEEQAVNKLADIMKEKLERMNAMMAQGKQNGQNPPVPKGQQEEDPGELTEDDIPEEGA